MTAVWRLACKDLRLLVRDRAAFFFAFVFPLIFATFFGMIFSGGGGASGGMPIAIVDEDQTTGSREFVAALEKSPSLGVTAMPLAQAEAAVQTGKQSAYVVITPGFGAARERLLWGAPPTLRLGLDPARRAEAGMLQGLLTQEMAKALQDLFSNPKKLTGQLDDLAAKLRGDPASNPLTVSAVQMFSASLANFLSQVEPETPATASGPAPAGARRGFEPVHFESADVSVKRDGPQNFYAISFPQGILWGVMGCAAGFGISLVSERSAGTLLRLRVAPIGTAHILAGKALACLLTVVGVCAAMILFAIAVFHVRPASYGLLALAIGSVAVGFVGVMMLLAAIGRTERAAGGIGWAVLTVMAMLGGGMVPLFFMPRWMQTVGSLSPVKWGILALEGAIWRGFSVEQMLAPCGILAAVGAAGFALGAVTFARQVQRG